MGALQVYRVPSVTIIRRQSVDSLNGGFFTRGFCAVGRSVKKKKKKEQMSISGHHFICKND